MCDVQANQSLFDSRDSQPGRHVPNVLGDLIYGGRDAASCTDEMLNIFRVFRAG
jgi:hypothetical protein